MLRKILKLPLGSAGKNGTMDQQFLLWCGGGKWHHSHHPYTGCGLQGSTALIYYLEDSEIK